MYMYRLCACVCVFVLDRKNVVENKKINCCVLNDFFRNSHS